METTAIQGKLLAISKVFDEICRENNIWYSLAFGSILGAVRHKGFIPWDPDMDVYVMLEDRDRLRSALLRELPQGYGLKNWEEDPKFPDGHDLIFEDGVSLYELRFDIFYLVGFPNDGKKRIKLARRNKKIYQFLRCKHKDISYSRKRNVLKSVVAKAVTQLIPDSYIMNRYRRIEKRYPIDTVDYIGWHSTGVPVNKEYILETRYVDFEDTKLPIPVKAHEYLTVMYGDYMTPDDWSISRS